MEHPTVYPALRYDDADAALDFLVEAFGAEEHAVFHRESGGVAHAELRFGNGVVMFGPAHSEAPSSAGRAVVYVVVPDPDAHEARARAAGAEIVRPPHDTDYGAREYAARDPEGNEWSFGTYQPFADDGAAAGAGTSGG